VRAMSRAVMMRHEPPVPARWGRGGQGWACRLITVTIMPRCWGHAVVGTCGLITVADAAAAPPGKFPYPFCYIIDDGWDAMVPRAPLLEFQPAVRFFQAMRHAALIVRCCCCFYGCG
jgi:hypothetical protein